jgi:hypothetical protein
MTQYTLYSNRVAFSPEELDALQKILDSGDRGAYYMAYQAMSGSRENNFGDNNFGDRHLNVNDLAKQ